MLIAKIKTIIKQYFTDKWSVTSPEKNGEFDHFNANNYPYNEISLWVESLEATDPFSYLMIGQTLEYIYIG